MRMMRKRNGRMVLTAYGLACGYIQQFGKAQVTRLPSMRVYLVAGENGKASFRSLREAYQFASVQ